MLKIIPPPIQLPAIVSKSKLIYIRWTELVKDFPKTSRHSLGSKIDQYFLSTLGYIYASVYQTPVEKSATLSKAIGQLDMVKFFLSIAWESAILQNNHYIQLSNDLDEVGRMLGGWKKGVDKTIQTKNSR